ncbi:MAG: hypothetical protein J6R77_00625, partial [Clostridia bacterium]|nr:hypothetical protein [Clostridia bacterium]
LEMEVTTEELGVATVEDVLYDTYASACVDAGMDVPLTREQMGEVLDRSTVDEFLAEKMSAFADDLLNDTGAGTITTEEILSLMKENEALIAEVSGGFVMTEEQYDMVAAAVEESGVTEELSVSALREEMDIPSELLPLFAPALLWGAIGACLFLFAVLALLNLRSRFLGFLYSGIGCLIAGAVCSLALAAGSLLTGLLRSEGDLPTEMMAPVLNQLLAGFWVPGLCLAGAGILLLVAFTVLRIVRRKQA